MIAMVKGTSFPLRDIPPPLHPCLFPMYSVTGAPLSVAVYDTRLLTCLCNCKMCDGAQYLCLLSLLFLTCVCYVWLLPTIPPFPSVACCSVVQFAR